jgi:hypothetical protein
MMLAGFIASVAATLAILVALPGLLSYAWEEHPVVYYGTCALIGVAILATVLVCILAVA